MTLICIAGLDWTDWQPAAGWSAAPLLWPLDLGTAAAAATLATGTLPERHGVIGEDEGWPLGTRPVSQASWRIRPFWTRLADAGLTTATLDWPGSAPGSAWPGLHVDDRFAAATGFAFDNWAVPPGALPDALDALRDLRVHPADLRGEQLLPIIPGLADIDQARTHSAERAARALARAATVQAAALYMLTTVQTDLLAVHLALPDELRRIGDGRVDDTGGQTFVRAAIERLRAAAPDRAFAIVGHGRNGEAGVMVTHGITLGPEPILVTDVAARICTALGVAYAPAEIPPPKESIDPRGHGYALPPGPPAVWLASRLALLARMLLSRAPASSRQLVDQALAAVPDNMDALRVKALCDAAAAAPEALAASGDQLEKLAPNAPWGSLARALADGLLGDKAAAAARLNAIDAGADEQFWSLIGTAWLAIGEPRSAEAAFARAPDRTDALLGIAQAAMATRDFRRAETLLHDALLRHPVNRTAHLLLAELYGGLGRAHEAAAARQRAEALSFA